MVGRRATPTRQGRSVKIDATPTIDLALAVKRKMIGMFGHGHMGESAFCRQPSFDQPMRCLGLDDAPITTTAGILGANRNEDLKAGWKDVEALAAVFADLHHVGAAAGADLLRGFDHLFDPRQVVRQMAEVALGCRSPCGAIGIAGVQRLTSGFGLGDSRLKVFEGQLTFIGVQLLGPLAIKSMPQLGDQVILTLGLVPQARNFGLHGQKRLPHGRRKAIQIKGVRERCGHTDSYRIRPQKPIFTR